MNKHIYDLLYYYNEDGEEGHDLEEVLLLEKIEKERIDALIKLLDHEDQKISYEAMLILISWGVEEGFSASNYFLDSKKIKNKNYEPHRIHKEDNVYDVLAYSFSVSLLNGKLEKEIVTYYKKLLNLYPQIFFESRFKEALLNIKDASQILPEIKNAIKESIKMKRYYQASQLLPVLAKHSKDSFESFHHDFTSLLKLDNRIKYNLEEAKELSS